jgi:hypothetical protein
MGNAQANEKVKKEGGDEDADDNDDNDEDELDLALRSTWQPSNYGSNAQDRRALSKFFKAAGGDGWRASLNWNKLSPLGMWYGITVGTRNGLKMVTELSLHHNRVRGNFSCFLKSFSRLSHFFLRQASFTRPPLNSASWSTWKL